MEDIDYTGNDTNDAWREYRAMQAAKRQDRRESFGELLNEIQKRFDVKELTPYQFRIAGKVDVYPSNTKWHILSINKRGWYKSHSQLMQLLNKHCAN